MGWRIFGIYGLFPSLAIEKPPSAVTWAVSKFTCAAGSTVLHVSNVLTRTKGLAGGEMCQSGFFVAPSPPFLLFPYRVGACV